MLSAVTEEYVQRKERAEVSQQVALILNEVGVRREVERGNWSKSVCLRKGVGTNSEPNFS